MHFSLSKKKRLFKLKDFIFLYNFSQKKILQEINFYVVNNNLKFSRIGISISKKCVKLASKRNRIKRIIKEKFRLNQKKICCFDFLIVIKKNIKDNKIKNTLEKLWQL